MANRLAQMVRFGRLYWLNGVGMNATLDWARRRSVDAVKY